MKSTTKPQLFDKLNIKHILVAVIVSTLFLQACSSSVTETVSPQARQSVSNGSARASAVVFSENFETAPLAWWLVLRGTSQAYGTTYGGSKKLDQANLYAVYNRTILVPVSYRTKSPIALTGTYTMTYTTITTATSLANAGIEMQLVDATTGAVTVIDTIPLTSTATPLTTRTVSFTASGNQYLVVAQKSTGMTSVASQAGHCYIDDIVIQ